jgi:hypothetical protein
MRTDYLFTSESVSEGHPDKVADQISDGIVDLFLSKDPEARIACETLTTTQLVVLAGEIRCKGVYENGEWAPGAKEEIEQTVRNTVKRIGYEQDGFHWETFRFENNLHGQSAHIAQGVDAADRFERQWRDDGGLLALRPGPGCSFSISKYEELAPAVRPARRFQNGRRLAISGIELVVAAIGVGLKNAGPALEMFVDMGSGAIA